MRPSRERAPVAYILKMYPRFSETFVLNELLELERQGVTLRIFSLREPDDGILHREVELVRGDVSYIRWQRLPAVARAHGKVFRRSPARYRQALLFALRRRRLAPLKYFLKAGVIADHIQREGICHIHAHFASSAASVALDVHRLTGVPYSFTAHAKDIYRDGLDLDHLRMKLDQARFAVTVSDYNRRHLARLGGRDVVRIYNGLDLRRFVPNDSRSGAGEAGTSAPGRLRRAYAASRSGAGEAGTSAPGRLRRAYAASRSGAGEAGTSAPVRRRRADAASAPDEPPLVLAVGRLVEKKGFDVLIRACELLRADGVRFRCLIVGKGELADDLQTMISARGLEQHVELAGPLPREKLLELFPRASVVAAPCVVGSDGNRDGLPTVLTEAMALKVPVVATPVTGIPELVEDGRTGLIVPERDAAALAAAIRRLIEEPETARRLAEAGRARVERDFDLHVNVRELRTLFEGAATR